MLLKTTTRSFFSNQECSRKQNKCVYLLVTLEARADGVVGRYRPSLFFFFFKSRSPSVHLRVLIALTGLSGGAPYWPTDNASRTSVNHSYSFFFYQDDLFIFAALLSAYYGQPAISRSTITHSFEAEQVYLFHFSSFDMRFFLSCLSYEGLNRPMSLSVPRMRDATISVVPRGQAPEIERVGARLALWLHTPSARSCRACKKDCTSYDACRR